MKLFSPAAWFCLASLSLAATPADWPQWRGPQRDGAVADPAHPLNSLPSEPKVLWKVDAGDGQASPVVAAGRLLFLDAKGGNETAHCLDAATGKPLWEQTVAPLVKFSNFGEGPRCTPLIEGDRVYVQSASGEFRCLNLADGKMRWHVNFETGYGATFLGNFGNDPEAKETAARRHGNNGSSVIDGSSIFVPVGSSKGATLVCFDKMTGREIWRAGNDNAAYASLMVATLAGARQVVDLTADALMGVETSSGQVLWRVPLKTGAKRHVCTPVISGDTVTVCSSSIGTIKFQITRKGADFSADKAWENKQLKTNLGTPVLYGKDFYTLGPGDRTDLVCLDFATGQKVWSQPGLGDYASIEAINDKLLVLNATGELIMVKATPEKYEELGRAQVCGKTWASPAYAAGRIYVKDDGHVTALSLLP